MRTLQQHSPVRLSCFTPRFCRGQHWQLKKTMIGEVDMKVTHLVLTMTYRKSGCATQQFRTAAGHGTFKHAPKEETANCTDGLGPAAKSHSGSECLLNSRPEICSLVLASCRRRFLLPEVRLFFPTSFVALSSPPWGPSSFLLASIACGSATAAFRSWRGKLVASKACAESSCCSCHCRSELGLASPASPGPPSSDSLVTGGPFSPERPEPASKYTYSCIAIQTSQLL